MNAKILLVDDDRNLLSACERNLRNKFELETAAGGGVGLEKIDKSGPYAVVVADRQMPGMDGVEFLARVKKTSPDTVRLMLTGNADMESVIRLVNQSNIFRFLTKPCPVDLLKKALEDALHLYQLTVSERELLNKTLNGSVKLLTDILALNESVSFNQSQTTRDSIMRAATRLGLENSWEIHLAVMLAPIGNVIVPPETLTRFRAGQPLSPAEDTMLANLPETAARLLVNIPRLEGVAQIVRYQKKNFDGSGLPNDQVAGEDIPVGARFLKIITDMCELEKNGICGADAYKILREGKGTYDFGMLTSLEMTENGQPATPIAVKKFTVSVEARSIVKGMILRSNVETRDGMLIAPIGHQVTDMTREKIRNFDSIAGIKEPILVEYDEAHAMA